MKKRGAVTLLPLHFDIMVKLLSSLQACIFPPAGSGLHRNSSTVCVRDYYQQLFLNYSFARALQTTFLWQQKHEGQSRQMEWNPKILCIPLTLLLTKRFHFRGQKPWCWNTYFFEEVYKKYSVLVISSFQGFFQWYKSTCSNFIAICGKMPEPSSNSSSTSGFFLSKDFPSTSHSNFLHLLFDMWMHNTCPVYTHICECVHSF